jgi:hypothetical protein
MSLQNIRFLPWGCVIVLVLFCSWLMYLIVDQSVTVDHQGQHAKIILQQRNTLANIINATGSSMSKPMLKKYLEETSTHSYFEKDDNLIVVDNVSFLFKHDKLIYIDVGQKKKQ